MRDRRRERPYFDQGRFWVREEPSRRHYVTRIAVWRTPFGEEIHREFLAELQSNRAIRWDDRVSRAEDRVRGRPAPTYEAMAGQLDDRLRTRRVEEEAAREERHEYLPPEARSNKDKDRWRTAARLARKTDPKLGSERLLEKALALFESATSTEELRAQLGPVRRRSPDYTYSVMRGWSVR